jgi:hypothetical protein
MTVTTLRPAELAAALLAQNQALASALFSSPPATSRQLH